MKFPTKALEQHSVFLGKTGSGKSYAMRGLVESLLDDGNRVCIVDPKGDWWGLKSSADGKKAGYPLVIFGGEHADVPMNQHTGGQIAELVGTGNRPCILDFGGWMVGERTRFWIDFAHGIFKHNRGPLWLVIDEVHNFAPQGKIMDPDAGKCLHWTNRLASEGRGKGLRILMASQRPQKVHKDTLTCAETLVAMRVIHPRDRDAVKEWIDGCGDPKQGGEVLNSLAQMPRGEAWVWSPEIGFLRRLTFPTIKTFDSFTAPTSDAKASPKGWAEVDLDEVRTKLSRVVEEAKANDPALLKAEIRRLKAEKPVAEQSVQVKEVQKPVFDDKDRKLLATSIARCEQFEETLKIAHSDIRGFKLELAILLASVQVLIGRQRPIIARPIAAKPRAIQTQRESVVVDDESRLGGPEIKLLAALKQFPEGVTKQKLALLTCYSHNGGAFNNPLGALRSKGLAEGYGGNIRITDAGANHPQIQDIEPLPTGQNLIDYWLAKLSGPQAAILKAVLESERPLTKEELAERCGYEPSGGAFNNPLGSLRTLGLIKRGWPAEANPDFA